MRELRSNTNYTIRSAFSSGLRLLVDLFVRKEKFSRKNIIAEK